MKKALVLSLIAATMTLMADQQTQDMKVMDINPSAMPKIQNGMDWSVFLTAEALYWRAHEDNLEYGVEANRVIKISPTQSLQLGKTELQDLEFDFDWGFRAGLGFMLPHDGWDLYFNYTYFFADSHNKADKAQDANFALYPRWINPTIVEGPSGSANLANVNSIEADWNLHLNLIDGTIGRMFATSKWLSLRPFAGVRGLWIHEKYKITHEGGTFSPNFITSYREDAVNMKNSSWGVGAIAGLDSEWSFAKNWSFYACFGLSVLYGHFNIDQEEVVANGDLTVVDLNHQGFHKGRAITDVAFGLRWDRMFCDDRFHFGLQLGWEEHIFFDQNQFVRFSTPNVPGIFDRGGNLTLQGATLSACFGF
jgi:hypothetical protein